MAVLRWVIEPWQKKLIWLRAKVKLASQCLALSASSDVPMMKNTAKTICKMQYVILDAIRNRSLKRKCGGTEQQEQATADKRKGILQSGALQRGCNVLLREAEYSALSLPATYLVRPNNYTAHWQDFMAKFNASEVIPVGRVFVSHF